MIELIHMDCMDYMATLPDGAFDLAVVDPPYGIGGDSLHTARKKETFSNFVKHPTRSERGRLSRGAGKLKNSALQNMDTTWDIAPGPEYFRELFRVSRNQVVWGGNYFTAKLPESRCWLLWDKEQPWTNFSAFELAWTSFHKPCQKFKWRNGSGQNQKRIHPTQKPVALYAWIYSLFAKPGLRILDTHLGSGSSAIAAHDAGLDFTGCELNTDYFNAAKERYGKHQQQGRLDL